MKKEHKTAFHYLRNRELGLSASLPRNDYKLFSTLMMSDNRVYQKYEEYSSTTSMHFEADRIYTDRYRRVFSAIGSNLIYDLNKTLFNDQSKERIIDSDIFYLTSASEPSSISCSELFIGLTDTHRLLLLNGTTGTFLSEFRLPPKDRGYNFSEIGIGKDNETMYVKGRLMNNPPTRQPHFVFAMFDLIPFRYRYTFALDEKMIGPFVNAMISQDILILVHSGSLLKCYSMEDILYGADKKHNEGAGTEVNQSNIILHPDASIDWPCPCLYSIRVTSDSLEMGGFPWHCLYKPPKSLSYRLQSLSTEAFVKLEKGQLEQIDSGQGMEVNVFFNPDESGTVIHVMEQEIRKFAISKNISNNGCVTVDHFQLKELWSISIRKVLTPEEDIFYTASGRRAFRAAWRLNDELQHIECVQYLSTIDALCVIVYIETSVNESEPPRSAGSVGQAKLLIVDNRYGLIKKEIMLEEPWSSLLEEHHVELDDDVLVHTIKHRSGKHSCHVYRLSEAPTRDEVQDQDKALRPKRRRSKVDKKSYEGINRSCKRKRKV